MRTAVILSVMLGLGLAPLGAAAKSLTDDELMKLFLQQRDAFRAAQSSGVGKTRGLTLVTVDAPDAATTTPSLTSPDTSDGMVALTAPGDATVGGAAGTLAQPGGADAVTAVAEPGAAVTTATPTLPAPGTETGSTVVGGTDGTVAVASGPDTLAAPTTDVVNLAAATTEGKVFGVLDPTLQVNVSIRFGFDSAALAPDQKPLLAQLCAVMQKSDIQLFQIVGHTDAAGTDAYNQNLSQLRAEEVQRYFVTDCGIAANRLKAVGMGERFLANPKDPKGGENRRVEFQALS